MLKAVIFDIDGTLVDSVDLHARAWQEAFAHFGHQVEFSAVRSQIGKGGDQLMPVFLSKEEIDRRGPEIEEHRSKLYKQKYLPKVRGFPEVRQLIERIKGNGLQVVLASSAKSDELQTYKQIVVIEDLTDEETSADDAKKSKPHPDIFKAALILLRHRIGLAPTVLRGALQQGHRARVVARATIRCRRIVAIELATCRSGRTGGASGWTILGNGRRRELIGGSAGG